MGLAIDKDFKQDSASRIIARNLVNDSLKNVPEVHRLACDSCYRNLSWSQLKTWLVKEFASPHHVRIEMESKLKALSYKRPCTVFISAVREVYQLHRQFYLSNGDALRRLIERIVDIVPAPVSSFLISKLYSINADWHHPNLSASHKNLSDPDYIIQIIIEYESLVLMKVFLATYLHVCFFDV